MKTINPEEGLKTLDKILASSHEEIGVFEIDWGKYQTVMQRTPFIQDLVNGQLQSQTHTSEVSPASFTSIEEVIDWLELQLSLTLGYQQKQVFDTDSGFFDLGLDSLTALDFKKNIEREAAVNLPSTLVFKYPTINQLAIFLYAEKQALSSDKQSHSKHESGAVEFIDEEFNSMMDEI
jgi:acyl carrier protein